MPHALVIGVGIARRLGGLARFRGRAAIALGPGDGGGLVGATQGCERRNKEGQNDLVTFFHDEIPITSTDVSCGGGGDGVWRKRDATWPNRVRAWIRRRSS
jgi:hypothetical protein